MSERIYALVSGSRSLIVVPASASASPASSAVVFAGSGVDSGVGVVSGAVELGVDMGLVSSSVGGEVAVGSCWPYTAPGDGVGGPTAAPGDAVGDGESSRPPFDVVVSALSSLLAGGSVDASDGLSVSLPV